MSSRAFRSFASCIALVALLAVTFMPTVTRAFSAGDGVDVCSTDASRGSTRGDSQHTLEHCPYCALHADLAAPPMPAGAVARALVAFRDLPPAFLQAPRATGVWSTSQPRAPPRLA